MLLIFCKIFPNVYIAKVDKDKKKANNRPYKLFGEFLSVVPLLGYFVYPPGSYTPSFKRFYRSAQSEPKIDLSCHTISLKLR